MASESFTGFGTNTRKFLDELAANNNRDWFSANKSRYEREVVGPAMAFIEAMEPHLAKISKRFQAIPAKQGGSLMRIYRDVRFAKNKSPYKTNVGIHFRHEDAKDVHAPGYYVHIQSTKAPGEYGTTGPFLGVGIWRPCPEALAAIRKRISEKPKEWLAARDDAGFNEVLTLEGDVLKRPPRGFDPEHSCIEDLKRKDFIGSHQLKIADISSAKFVKHVADVFAAASPLMQFLCKSVGARY